MDRKAAAVLAPKGPLCPANLAVLPAVDNRAVLQAAVLKAAMVLKAAHLAHPEDSKVVAQPVARMPPSESRCRAAEWQLAFRLPVPAAVQAAVVIQRQAVVRPTGQVDPPAAVPARAFSVAPAVERAAALRAPAAVAHPAVARAVPRQQAVNPVEPPVAAAGKGMLVVFQAEPEEIREQQAVKAVRAAGRADFPVVAPLAAVVIRVVKTVPRRVAAGKVAEGR